MVTLMSWTFVNSTEKGVIKLFMEIEKFKQIFLDMNSQFLVLGSLAETGILNTNEKPLKD